MQDKIFIGNGKEKHFDGGGSITSIVIDVDSILREFANHGFVTDQGKRKIKLNIGRRREADQYGNTHHVSIDTWHPDNYTPPGQGGQPEPTTRSAQPQQPKPSYKPPAYKPPEESSAPEPFEDDIPF